MFDVQLPKYAVTEPQPQASVGVSDKKSPTKIVVNLIIFNNTMLNVS